MDIEPTITPFEVGRLRFDLTAIYKLSANHAYNGRVVTVPIYCYHIAVGERSVLVDAPAYEPEIFGSFLVPDLEPPLSLPEQLTAAGVEPEAITDVVITHRHFDHFNGVTRWEDGRYVPLCPNARHYLGAGDWRPDDFGALEERTLVPVNDAGLLTLVGEATDIGDGLRIVPKPGETRGHQILALAYDGRWTYFIGDLFHNEIEFEYGGLNVFWAHAGKMGMSKRSFLKEAAVTAEQPHQQVYFAHIPGPYQVIRAKDGFEWQKVAG